MSASHGGGRGRIAESGINGTDHVGSEAQIVSATSRPANRPSLSLYRTPRAQIAESVRSLIAFRSIVAVDPALLLRAIEVYEIDRLDFAEAYLVACAQTTAVGAVASFDQSIDRVTTVDWIEPPHIRS